MSRVALILVEGETEEEFYSLLVDKYCKSHPKRLKNLHGNFSINNKILDKSFAFAENNPNDEFDVYVCIDQERLGSPAYNHQACLVKLKELPNFRNLVGVVAILMCESLFFIDIEGVYKYLKTPKGLRNVKKYSNHRTFTHIDLSSLFKRFNKTYSKGKRCQNFVSHLDLGKISKAKEISDFLTALKKTLPAKAVK